MPTKPVRKESISAKKIRLLENRVKRLEKLLKIVKELERKIDHVYDLDEPPSQGNNDRLNRPIHP